MKVRTIFITIITITILLLISGCSKLEKPNKLVIDEINRYNNPFPISEFKDNWGEEFGIQAPFIIRHLGTYYMYISTPNNGLGVKLYKSEDLINWTYEKNVFGISLSSETTDEMNLEDSIKKAHGAVAPEVRYFNGRFYLYTSITRGTGAPVGHVVYYVTSPTGTFSNQRTYSELNQDGTVFIDDDEKMYFLTSGGNKPGVINLYTMSKLDIINTNAKQELMIDDSGQYYYHAPYMFKKGDYYYLIYSRTKKDESGYEIDYSYSKELDVTKFIKNENGPLITNNTNGIKGAYHVSVFLGPDLLTYYAVYNDENNRLVISPIKFDGKLMYIDVRAEDNITPKRPDFEEKNKNSELYEQIDGRLLSKIITASDYVAEFNFSGVSTLSLYPNLYLSYQDKDNYLKIGIEKKTITLTQVKNGKSTVVAQEKYNFGFIVSYNHTVFVEKRGNKIDIYFNGMRKISTEINVGGGRIGYGTGNPERIAYTAFTSITSNNAYINYVEGNILARSYLPYHSKLTKSIIREIDNAYFLTLKENNYVTYTIDVPKDGIYELIFTYNNEAKVNSFYLSLDGQDYQIVKLPKEKGKIISVKLTELNLTKGIHSITVSANGFEFSNIKIMEKSNNF